MTRCILFDLGGTLWDDWPAELEYWRICAGLLTEAGHPCTVQQFISESTELIDRYCPSLSRALVWRFAGYDDELSARIRKEASSRVWELLEDDGQLAKLYPLWPGVYEVLAELGASYRLGVVSMHGSRVRPVLQRMGLAEYFEAVSLCDEAGLYKPDPRIIQHALDAMALQADDCIMVGDRIDNDIWPANCLGLRSVWLQVHPYDRQLPRYELDRPGLVIRSLDSLPPALRAMGWIA
ncbi:HAD family hydrolase [bacterium]|nr:HAD family hydrolase [bacterium]